MKIGSDIPDSITLKELLLSVRDRFISPITILIVYRNNDDQKWYYKTKNELCYISVDELIEDFSSEEKYQKYLNITREHFLFTSFEPYGSYLTIEDQED